MSMTINNKLVAYLITALKAVERVDKIIQALRLSKKIRFSIIAAREGGRVLPQNKQACYSKRYRIFHPLLRF